MWGAVRSAAIASSRRRVQEQCNPTVLAVTNTWSYTTGTKCRYLASHIDKLTSERDELTNKSQPLTGQTNHDPLQHKSKVDTSKVPKLNEHDLHEVFISGSGPGGQCVNKSVNCCQLKHRPTGLLVKVHHTRSLEKNRQIARQLLTQKLDNLYNGEQSVEAQKRRQALRKIQASESKAEQRRSMKELYKRRVLNQREPNQGA